MSYLATQARVRGGLVYKKKKTQTCRWENNEKWRRYSSIPLSSDSQVSSDVFKFLARLITSLQSYGF